jgi:cell division protein FtsB
MRVGRYLVIFIVFMAILITFGNRGLLDNYRMGKKLTAIQLANNDIIQENREYQTKIDLLKNHLGYIEMVARNELGMVRKGEMVYRFSK